MHIYIYMCVCVCVCVYIYIYIFIDLLFQLDMERNVSSLLSLLYFHLFMLLFKNILIFETFFSLL